MTITLIDLSSVASFNAVFFLPLLYLLPILFEVNSLREQLRLRVKDLEIEKAV